MNSSNWLPYEIPVPAITPAVLYEMNVDFMIWLNSVSFVSYLQAKPASILYSKHSFVLLICGQTDGQGKYLK